MPFKTDDVRIKGIHELAPPSHLIREFPVTDKAATTVYTARQAMHRVLHGMEDRLVVVIGPCSSTTSRRPRSTRAAWRPSGGATPPSSRS